MPLDSRPFLTCLFLSSGNQVGDGAWTALGCWLTGATSLTSLNCLDLRLARDGCVTELNLAGHEGLVVALAAGGILARSSEALTTLDARCCAILWPEAMGTHHCLLVLPCFLPSSLLRSPSISTRCKHVFIFSICVGCAARASAGWLMKWWGMMRWKW